MRYLKKRDDSRVVARGLTYPKDSTAIRDELVEEQHGFCAYSEKWLEPLDSVHVEHFNPDLKTTSEDGYRNWYAVCALMNLRRPRKIERYQPILDPASELAQRIEYDASSDLFFPKQPRDIEAQNLINFLGMNRPELVKQRSGHAARVQEVLELGARWEQLRATPWYCAFATTLQSRGLDVDF